MKAESGPDKLRLQAAVLVYRALNHAQRQTVDGLLHQSEVSRLRSYPVFEIAAGSRKAAYDLIRSSVPLVRGSAWPVKTAYYLLQIATLIACVIWDRQLIPLVIVYTVAGMLFLESASNRHWQFRWVAPAASGLPLVMLMGTSFACMVLMLGSLSLYALPARIQPAILLTSVIAGPAFEEILFRERLYRNGGIVPMLVSSLLFSLSHYQSGYDAQMAATYVICGMLLCAIRWHSGVLWPTWLVHAAVNLTLLLL